MGYDQFAWSPLCDNAFDATINRIAETTAEIIAVELCISRNTLAVVKVPVDGSSQPAGGALFVHK